MSKEVTVTSRVNQVFSGGFDSEIKTPNELKPDRIRSALLTAMMHTPNIARCSVESLRKAVMKAAADGLAPDGREAALVEFKGQAQYIPMYQGLIKRAKQMGELFSISCLVVYSTDEFSYVEGAERELIHKPNVWAEDRGQKVGAYAVFRDKEGRVIHIEVMGRAAIEQSRSIAKTKKVWEDWEDEMWRKTVIRRGLKYVAASEGLHAIASRDDELNALEPVEVKTRTDNPLATAAGVTDETVIDNETGEVIDETADDIGKAREAGVAAAKAGSDPDIPNEYTPQMCEAYFEGFNSVGGHAANG